MEWWHVYLFTRLDRVTDFFTGCFIASILAICVGNFICLMSSPDGEEIDYIKKYHSKLGKWFIILFFIISPFWVMLPTQKEAAAIYLVPKMVNSDTAKELSEIPKDAAKILHLKLEEWIKDMEPSKEKK